MMSFFPIEAGVSGTFLGYDVDNEADVGPGEAVCRIETA
jgi:hypothetical protein